ncbi:MAG: hypothetical protein ACI4BB_05635 [Coprococcus sp.]
MKKYDEDNKEEMIICNCCGRTITWAGSSDKAAFLEVNQEWGYFSKWDGCSHSFHMCEQCYEKMIGTWVYPPDIKEKTELL